MNTGRKSSMQAKEPTEADPGQLDSRLKTVLDKLTQQLREERSGELEAVKQEFREENKKLEEELQAVKDESKKLEKELQAVKDESKKLEEELQAVKDENRKLEKELQDVKNEMEQLKSKVNATAAFGGSTGDGESCEPQGYMRSPQLFLTEDQQPDVGQSVHQDVTQQISQLHQEVTALKEAEKDKEQRTGQLYEDLKTELQHMTTKVHQLREEMDALSKQEDMTGDKKPAKKKSFMKRSEPLQKKIESGSEMNLSELKKTVDELQKDMNSNVLQKIETLAKEKSQLKNEMEALQKTVQSESTKEQIDSLRKEDTSLRKLLNDLQAKLEASCKEVSFHVKLRSSVTKNEHGSSTLICKDVVTNTGDRYNPETGIFSAPVAGTYCFFATSSPNDPDDNVPAALDVVVEGKVCGGLCAYGDGWATAHCVVELEAENKVWLRTPSGKHEFAAGWWTTFSGMLVRPRLS